MDIGSLQTGWNSSVQGYQKAEGSMASHAKNIATASAQASSDNPQPANSPDLATEMVGMKTDQISGSYNLKALKVQDKMAGELMDLVG